MRKRTEKSEVKDPTTMLTFRVPASLRTAVVRKAEAMSKALGVNVGYSDVGRKALEQFIYGK